MSPTLGRPIWDQGPRSSSLLFMYTVMISTHGVSDTARTTYLNADVDYSVVSTAWR